MTEQSSQIAARTTVQARISGEGDLVVDGRLNGDVELDGQLTIGADGVVVGAVSVSQACVDGVLVGDLVATGLVELTPTARVVGDLTAPRLSISAGAQVRGVVSTGAEQPAVRQTSRREAPDRRDDLRDRSEPRRSRRDDAPVRAAPPSAEPVERFDPEPGRSELQPGRSEAPMPAPRVTASADPPIEAPTVSPPPSSGRRKKLVVRSRRRSQRPERS